MAVWKPVNRNWQLGPEIFWKNNKFVVAKCRKSVKPEPVYALKLAILAQDNDLIDMEYELHVLLRSDTISDVKETVMVRYHPNLGFQERGAKSDHKALLFPKVAQTAYEWFRASHLYELRPPPAEKVLALLRSALVGLKYLHDQGVVLRKFRLQDLEVIDDTFVRYTNLGDACLLPQSIHASKVKMERWVERQKQRNFDVRFISHELAMELTEKIKRPKESYPVDAQILMTSDVFLVGAAFYFGLRMTSVYSTLFTPNQILGLPDLNTIIDNYPNVRLNLDDSVLESVIKIMTNWNPSVRKDISFLLQYVDIPSSDVSDESVPFQPPEFTLEPVEILPGDPFAIPDSTEYLPLIFPDILFE